MRIVERTMTRRAWVWFVGCLAAGGLLVVLGVSAYEHWSYDPHQILTRDGTEPSDPFYKVRIAGIARPPTVDAARSTIDPDERVIGFVVAGRARAYRLDALRNRTKHIVNDMVGDVPLSVTYCDLDDCVRAYTSTSARGPLGVSVAGLFEGHQLILEVEGQNYFQRSGRRVETSTGPAILPLDRVEPTLTTWGSWKRDHPNTDAYEGAR